MAKWQRPALAFLAKSSSAPAPKQPRRRGYVTAISQFFCAEAAADQRRQPIRVLFVMQSGANGARRRSALTFIRW
jgi:hypothetical protein